jgi:serine/threonine protein kinase
LTSPLNHPVIARGFGGVLEGERPQICIEFLEGPRLSTLIRKFGPVPVEQLVPLDAPAVFGASPHAPAADGAPRVKPKSIIMGAPPRLIDLSIARSFSDAAALDVAVGTDAYMAPEQCTPTPGRVGAPADIWGLGVTPYEAVAGEIPLPRGSDDERHPQINLPPRPLDRRVPGAIAELVDECLRRDPR